MADRAVRTPAGYVHCSTCDYIKPGRKRNGVHTCDDCHGKATHWASLPDDEKARIIEEFNADRYGLYGDD